MTAAELHGAFATNATVANFNNEFHGKHAANLSASSPYPVYKLWL
jgi:acetylornithine/succinyldiaminopimelate/putrescine aminotransferase